MIELKNVERSYKTGHTETWVLRRIGLTIQEGEFVTIMGPSGAGKSSLLNVLALLDDGWLGEYWFGQTPVHTLNRKRRADLARQRIGMVFQSYHLLDDLTIVGVVGDVKHQDLRTAMGPGVYRPYLQNPHPVGVQIYVRSAQPPQVVEPAIRQSIRRLDPTLVVDGLRTMDAQIDRSAADESALAYLAIGFSVLAMLLAAVGLYGVLAYSIQQRTREIGVRLALGSARWSVAALVVREMALIAALAMAVALPSTVALARLFRSQLYGVAAFDPLTLCLAALVTAATLALAAALPARRAASVEPMKALRTE